MGPIRQINLALRFLLELCALAALAYWGFTTDWGTPLRIVLGIGAPVLMAVVWGAFVAPKARAPTSRAVRIGLGLLVMGIAAVALAVAGRPVLAGVLGAIIVINTALVAVWEHASEGSTRGPC
jgi:hypothetical protein